jgi:hypothetical protein
MMINSLRPNLAQSRLDTRRVERYGFRLFLASATSEEKENRDLPRYGNESVHEDCSSSKKDAG